MTSLYNKLEEYSKTKYYPMHMPGHKRNTEICHMPNPYSMDITEIDEFDDLHDATEIIKESMCRAAKLYHAENTYYLVNGSTVGLLAGIAVMTQKQDKVLVARNCHKAVYHALFLSELEPIYVYPTYINDYGICGGIDKKQIEKALQEQESIALIIITSPTYEGVVSDIQSIVALAHTHNIPVLVDEAHGAHFGFHKEFPRSAIECGADLVIQSVHKTLPSFTQTALLHKNGPRVNQGRLEQYLAIYQTSSPSYLLMGSIDQCISLIENKGIQLFEEYWTKLGWFYNKVRDLQKIRILTKQDVKREDPESNYNWDPSKIIISVKDTTMNGMELHARLREQYKLQMELTSKDYVIAMTSLCDTWDGLERLLQAILEIDVMLTQQTEQNHTTTKLNVYHIAKLPIAIQPYDVQHYETEQILLKQADNRISAEYVYLYPPGIPIIVPGEVITEELVQCIKSYKSEKLSFKGMKDKTGKYIQAVIEPKRKRS